MPRLLFVLLGAIVLVSLPVLPLKTLLNPGLVYISHLNGMTKKGTTQVKPDRQANKPVAALKQEALPAVAQKPSERGLKEIDEASGQLLVQISKTPADPSLHNQLAIMYAGLGDFQSAIDHFLQAVDLARAQITALKESERELRSKGEDDKACAILLQSSKLQVELSAAHSSLARVYDQLGEHDKVVAQLDQLNEDIQFGADTSDKSEKPPPKPQLAQAEDEHQLDSVALLVLARAQALLQARRLPEAVAMFKKVLALDPKAAVAHQQLGYIAILNNNFGAAVEELEQAESLDPDCATTYSELAVAYQAQGQNEHAIAMFDKALALNPKDADSAFNKGSLLACEGKYAEAEEAFKQAIENNPRLPLAHNHLGTLLSFDGNYEQAIKEFQQAIALAPDLASAHYGLGLALYNTKNYSASVPEFKRALVLNPSLVDAHNKIEQAYRNLGLANATIGTN